MSRIVAKFGGTSMATAESINRIIKIIKSDFSRRFIVVSAPGKKAPEDKKITDILFECAVQVKLMGDCPLFDEVEETFTKIVQGLNLKINIAKLLAETKKQIIETNSVDFAASRGEYLAARIMAEAIGFEFVDASELIVFDDDGNFLSEETNEKCYKYLDTKEAAVIPGFYGKMLNGQIKTFSRGGSDITGAIIARATLADLYENWTDVDGFLAANPAVVLSPRQICSLSYKELRELSYMGASVLHAESVFPVWESGIPINIKNTFNPTNPGTMIVPTISENAEHGVLLTGISGKQDYTVFHLEKDLMSNSPGFARKVLTVLENNNVPFEFMPSGIDALSLVIESRHLNQKLINTLTRELQSAVLPDLIEITDKMAVIAIVGRNIKAQPDTISKIFEALKRAGITIRLVDIGSNGLSVTVGVNNYDFEKAISAVYFRLTQ